MHLRGIATCVIVQKTKKKKKMKTKKLSQFLKAHSLGTAGTIYLKFRTWATDSGQQWCSFVVEMSQSSHYCFSCQYTHGVEHWYLGLHDTAVCLVIVSITFIISYCVSTT